MIQCDVQTVLIGSEGTDSSGAYGVWWWSNSGREVGGEWIPNREAVFVLGDKPERRSSATFAKPESNNSPGNYLVDGRRISHSFVKSDEPSRLNDGNFPTPFETRTDSLHSPVGAIPRLPIGADKKNVAIDDYGTVVDTTGSNFLREFLLNLDVPGILETLVLRDDRSERHPCWARATGSEDEPVNNACCLV